MSNILIAMDAALAAMEIAARWTKLIQTAKAEGREISDKELAALTASNKSKLELFDQSIGL